MFTFESIVDTVNGAQTKVVETLVTDKKIQGELIKLLDAQAKFAKTSFKNTVELAEIATKNFNELMFKKAGA